MRFRRTGYRAPPGLRLFAGVMVLALAAMLVFAAPAPAQDIPIDPADVAEPYVPLDQPKNAGTTPNFNDIGSFTSTIKKFNDDINKKINEITSGGNSDYRKMVDIMMYCMAVIFSAIALAKWMFDKTNLPDLLGAAIQLVFVMALFLTYPEVVQVLSDGPHEIMIAIQKAALGSDDAFAPMTFMYKVITTINFVEKDGTWNLLKIAQQALANAVFGVFFLAVQAFYLLAIAYVTLFPIVYYFALKILGFVMIPFLLAGRLDFLFYGWLRQMIMLGLFVLFGSAVSIAVVLLVAFAFNLNAGAMDALIKNPGMGTYANSEIVGFLAKVLCCATLLFGMIALFFAQKIAAAWSQSDSLGHGAVSGAAQKAGGAIVTYVKGLRS